MSPMCVGRGSCICKSNESLRFTSCMPTRTARRRANKDRRDDVGDRHSDRCLHNRDWRSHEETRPVGDLLRGGDSGGERTRETGSGRR